MLLRRFSGGRVGAGGSTGSGWATLIPADGSSEAEYEFKLPTSESYSLHVGCGGTAASWGIAVYSPFEEPPSNSFECHDIPGGTDYKSCDLT